jgi:hypothetical protein
MANPQSLNLYAYALNNPLRFVDPTGLYCAWDDGSSDSDPSNGGASEDDCNSQGGHWTDDHNPCDDVTDGSACVATFDWNKPATDDAYYDQDLLNSGSGDVIFTPSQPPSVNGLTYSSCMLMSPGGNYTVGSNAIPSFQPAMAADLTVAFQSLNAQGITPMITSGFRTGADQERAAAQARAAGRPAAPIGHSPHQVGLAADMNSRVPAATFDATKNALTGQGLTWGGNFRKPDDVHFQLPAAGTPTSSAAVSRCGSGG